MQKSSSVAEPVLRWWDVPAVTLVALSVFVAGLRLTVTQWTPDLNYALNMGMFGVILGLALGKSIFGKRTVGFLSSAYLLVLLPYQLMADLDRDVFLGERLLSTGNRLLFSIHQFITNQPVEDHLLFVTFLCIVYWFVGVTAGYYFVRYASFLAAVLPAGIVIMTIHIYDRSSVARIWLLAFYLFICLLLLGRNFFLHNRLEWTKRRVHLSMETMQDLSTGMVIGAAIVILLAWSLPQAVPYARSVAEQWDEITQPWDTFLERMNDAVASVDNEGGGSKEGVYSGKLILGTSNPLSTETVFTVLARDDVLSFPRLYWRGRIYDTYENGYWSDSKYQTHPFSPVTGDFSIPDTLQRSEIEFTYNVLTEEQSMLYAPPQPVWVSRPADTLQINISENREDLIAIIAAPSLQRGEVYRVHAALANPSIQELREAGNIYPEWVIERYLQLPDDLSPRLRELAERLTTGLDTPYDKTNAITNYLRNEIKYSTAIDLPAKITDPLDYVIFDLKEGFCTYYASAEVLMLRAAGIPARMAVGYAQGESDINNRGEDITIKYIVRRRDAHAWPEVYFPAYGWIEFEPTSNQEALVRPLDNPGGITTSNIPILPGGLNQENQNLAEKNQEPEESSTNTTTTRQPANLYRLAVWIILALLVGGYYAERKYSVAKQVPGYISQIYTRNGSQPPKWLRNWAQWTQLSSIERSFQSINISLEWLGAPQPIHVTPNQRAQKLGELLPDAKSAIETLEQEHRKDLFTQRPGYPAIARSAAYNILKHTIRKRILKVLGYN